MVIIFAAVADLVKDDHQIASRMIAESLNIPKIQKRQFGKEKVVCIFCSMLLEA